MRKLNKWTKKTALQMPVLEAQLSRIGKGKIFGTFDILSGFDFLRTHEESQKYFTLVTNEGSYTMIGAPMGWTNTPQLFQSRILEEILKPAGIYSKEDNGCLQWVDDTLLYADSFTSYINVLEKF